MRDEFAALREQDEKDAPSFDAMMRKPRPPHAARTSPLVFVLPAAAAAGLAMAAAFVLWIGVLRAEKAPPASHAAVTLVQPNEEPLAFLLAEPATLARVPDFDSSPIKERR